VAVTSIPYRIVEKLAQLAAETRAQTFAVDASDPAAVARLFDKMMEVAAQDIALDAGSFSVPGTNIAPLPSPGWREWPIWATSCQTR
jgi:hypothetical protein